MGVVAVRQVGLGDGLGAADAFGDVLAGHLDVDAAGMGALGAVDVEERFDLRQDPVEGPRLVAAAALIVLPCIGSQDQTTFLPSRSTARISAGRCLPTLSAPKRQISVRRPGSLSGLSMSISFSNSSGSMVGPHFTPIGFFTPRRNSTWAWSGWRVRSPIHSMWPEVAYQSPEVESTAGQRLLVAQQQRLVAGIEARGAQLRRVFRRDPNGPHEAQRLGDVIGQFLVAVSRGLSATKPRFHWCTCSRLA